MATFSEYTGETKNLNRQKQANLTVGKAEKGTPKTCQYSGLFLQVNDRNRP